MKSIFSPQIVVSIAALCAAFAFPSSQAAADSGVRARAWTPDNGNGTYTNPLMWGDWPDPDVIRVNDTFYFSSTSMHYLPGCPIAESKDLVNWKMAGYAIERYDESPLWDMKGGHLYLDGSWATTLRYHDGKFYLGFWTPAPRQFSMCVATDVRGPWKRTIIHESLYDPGLLFDDDGRVYVVHGQGDLYVTELNADALSVKNPAIKIWDKEFDGSGNLAAARGFKLEGSHAYKINGQYYITCAGGGTHGFQICLRSKNILGPYECKCICKDDSSYPKNGLHQGGMVQLKDGSWWFIIMQDRGPIGRVPNLVPVKWVDGWPMLGKNGEGKGVVTGEKPNVGQIQPIDAPATSDEFDSPQLGLQWQWNHNPDNANWSLTERPGYMRLKAGTKVVNLNSARNSLTQRVQGPQSEGVVKMDVGGLKDGDCAGLAMFQAPYSCVAVVQENGIRTLVRIDDGKTVATGSILNGNTVWLKAIATTQGGYWVRYEYSTDGQTFHPIGERFGMHLGLAWTANRYTLFNYSTTDAGICGFADFDWFHMDVANATSRQ